MRIIIEIDDGKVTTQTMSESPMDDGDILVSGAHDAGAAPAESGDESLAMAQQGDVFGDVVPEYITPPMAGEDAGSAPALADE